LTVNEKNIINKLVIDIRLPGDQKQQDEKSDRVKAAVLDGIYSFTQNFTDRISDKIYRTDLLQINIPVYQEKWSDIADEVEKQLKEHFLQKGEPLLQLQGDRKPGQVTDVRQLTSVQKSEELLLYYLMHGFYPWWSGTFEGMKVTDTLLAECSTDFWELKLRPLLKNNPVAVERIVKQFSVHAYRRILYLATGDESVVNKAIGFAEEVEKFFKKRPDSFPYGFTEMVIAIIRVHLLNYFLDKRRKLTGNWESRFIEAATDVFMKKVPLNTCYEWIESLENNKGGKRKKWAEVAEKQLLAYTGKPAKNFSEIDKNEERNVIAAVIEQEDFNVSQSGLVLLHPFISRLFEKTGYLEDGSFRSDEARERAVCLLHYLATGENEYPEPELMLPMHLCSWPAGIPVNRFLKLSDYEKEECSRLLKNTIEHWKAIKNTSEDGLRVNFLMRNGRLKKGEFGWTLHIEHKTHDVLLNMLPWGISIIKFKWMSEHLTVDWKNSLR
jgi:hypothetical protein